jgi:hypothetical protein
MISIIICSVSQEMLANVSLNIEKTIGVPYEIIAFDNSLGKKGICEVYNDGAKKAKFEVLCFMHEDIEYQTNDWGNIVFDIFTKIEKIGVLGVVGSSYKASTPSGWGAEGFEGETTFSNYIQSYKRKNADTELIHHNPGKKDLARVACVDGMWICTTKSIVMKKPFDEKLLKGFHCYDIDFCLNVGQDLDVLVTFDILMRHFSEGSFDEHWLSDTLNVHEKWSSILPKITSEVSKLQQDTIEKRAFKGLIKHFLKENFTLKKIHDTLWSYRKNKKISLLVYIKLHYYAMKFYFQSAK